MGAYDDSIRTYITPKMFSNNSHTRIFFNYYEFVQNILLPELFSVCRKFLFNLQKHLQHLTNDDRP